jgi:hypothetical protein
LLDRQEGGLSSWFGIFVWMWGEGKVNPNPDDWMDEEEGDVRFGCVSDQTGHGKGLMEVWVREFSSSDWILLPRHSGAGLVWHKHLTACLVYTTSSLGWEYLCCNWWYLRLGSRLSFALTS